MSLRLHANPTADTDHTLAWTRSKPPGFAHSVNQ